MGPIREQYRDARERPTVSERRLPTGELVALERD